MIEVDMASKKATVVRNEEVIRKYIRNQEIENIKLDKDLGLFSKLR